MYRRALVVTLVIGLAALPATSGAYEIKPKTPETGFSGKLRPDILGISTDSTAESARAAFEASFKGRTDTKTDIQQQKFADTAIGYIAALNVSVPSGPKQTGEVMSSSFSSPASANRSYFIARNITFAPDQQPAKADMIKEVMGKYGSPTIVGDQHLYYIYRSRLDRLRRREVQAGGSHRRHRQAARSEDRRQTQRRDRPRQLRRRGQALAGQGKDAQRHAG